MSPGTSSRAVRRRWGGSPMRQHRAADKPRIPVNPRGRAQRQPGPGRRHNGHKAMLALAEAARDLAATLDLSQRTKLVVSSIFRLFGVARAVLYQLDEAGSTLVCIAAAGRIDPQEWVGQSVPISDGIVG